MNEAEFLSDGAAGFPSRCALAVGALCRTARRAIVESREIDRRSARAQAGEAEADRRSARAQTRLEEAKRRLAGAQARRG